FPGLWHITSMTGCDEEFLSAEVRAFIEFEPGRVGALEFAYVRAALDYRPAQRDGQPAVEFSWSGLADTAPVCGRGWAVRAGHELHGRLFIHLGDELHGRLFIHLGDEHGFVAERAQPN